MASNQILLDPYECIPKRFGDAGSKNQKYASECTEVYLANRNAAGVSEEFCRFANLEVIWFNGNRLSRLEHLENNFRLREVFIQDNRIVSLNGLNKFKFLRVLLASNNQIRNLDKQIALLSRFGFLKKLDLFGNPCAEEPDYRLRLIYHCPQVEILDRHTVKGPERIKADEVVPNLDKVSAAKAEKAKKKALELSLIERDCFREARQIKDKRDRDADEAFNMTFTRSIGQDTKAPGTVIFQENLKRWANPKDKVIRELGEPTPWEKYWGENAMRPLIIKIAGKDVLDRDDVTALAERLYNTGIVESGRRLGNAQVFQSRVKDGSSSKGISKDTLRRSFKGPKGESQQTEQLQGLDRLRDDPEATMKAMEVADALLALEWPRIDDHVLDARIARLYEDARRAELSGDAQVVAVCRNHALRLEGAKSLKSEVLLGVRAETGSKSKLRMDTFTQSKLHPQRAIDDVTGRTFVQVCGKGGATKLSSLENGIYGSKG